jgi:hypothetical protein
MTVDRLPGAGDPAVHFAARWRAIDALAAVPPARDLPSVPALSSPTYSQHRGSFLPTLLGLVALGVAIGALVRTFWIAR